MNRPGPGPQPLRAMSGNFFNQQAAPSRGAPLGRLQQNGKMGSGSSWFGIGQGNAPGMSNTASRGNSAGLTSFAQTLGGGQQHASLDLSEFPSLGGNQQTQHNALSQAIWGTNSNLRGNGQQAAVQRPQGQVPAQVPSLAAAQQQQASEDNFVFGGQGGVGQLAGLSQTQTAGNIHANRAGATSPTHDTDRGGRLGLQGFSGRPEQPSTVVGYRPPYQESQPSGQENEPQTGIGSAALLESPPQQQQAAAQRPATQKRLAEMTEMERWGMPGLLALFSREHPDYSELAAGFDPNSFGLDLSSNSPLYPIFGVPFDNLNQRPVLPDFQLPSSYTVSNVPSLESRINTFTDDTLFAIFYQYPRDLRQELAAQELYNRDWRWHKQLRQWMMKDTSMPPPHRIDNHTEDGYYIFFDSNAWKRDKRSFRLNYEHLDQRPQAHQTVAVH